MLKHGLERLSIRANQRGGAAPGVSVLSEPVQRVSDRCPFQNGLRQEN